MKINCWEFKGCGREAGGYDVASLGVCPASVEIRANGIHGGINGGRCCWVIAGTFCDNKIQGAFDEKFNSCAKCDFFALVTQEEYTIMPIVEMNKRINAT